MSEVFLVVGILVFLIVVHELGHFIAAKLFKVRVEEFGIGYPPRAFLLGIWKGTEYTLNWLPFGGFVRLFGEHGETRSSGSFASAPKIAQAVILIAGVTANALAAWFLFAGALSAGVPRIITERSQIENARLFVNLVVPGSPADAAGVRAGDEITGMKDSQGKSAALKPSSIIAFVSERGGKPIDLTFRRNEEILTAVVVPAHAVVDKDAGRPAVGFGVVLVTDEALSFSQALREAGPRTVAALYDTVAGLGTLLHDAIAGEPNIKNIVGPVGLLDYVYNASRHGVGHVLQLAGFISINLAVINLIPVPALDGGRLVIVGIEAILRREVHRISIQVVNFVGIMLIILLMLAVTYNDIARLLA